VVWLYFKNGNKENFKVYDNGKLLATVATGSAPVANSEANVTIGNQASRDANFRGYIREVKIGDGIRPEAEILATGQQLDASLNTLK